jgi:CheY-like chemotaxis protein
MHVLFMLLTSCGFIITHGARAKQWSNCGKFAAALFILNDSRYNISEESELEMKKKIYIADDEQNIRDLIYMFLTSEGFDVTAFSDGDTLLKTFSEIPADMVILDIMMPGTDGLSLCTQIRKNSRTPYGAGRPCEGSVQKARTGYGHSPRHPFIRKSEHQSRYQERGRRGPAIRYDPHGACPNGISAAKQCTRGAARGAFEKRVEI